MAQVTRPRPGPGSARGRQAAAARRTRPGWLGCRSAAVRSRRRTRTARTRGPRRPVRSRPRSARRRGSGHRDILRASCSPIHGRAASVIGLRHVAQEVADLPYLRNRVLSTFQSPHSRPPRPRPRFPTSTNRPTGTSLYLVGRTPSCEDLRSVRSLADNTVLDGLCRGSSNQIGLGFFKRNLPRLGLITNNENQQYLVLTNEFHRHRFTASDPFSYKTTVRAHRHARHVLWYGNSQEKGRERPQRLNFHSRSVVVLTDIKQVRDTICNLGTSIRLPQDAQYVLDGWRSRPGFPCAVERRCVPAGANPARQLSLQPEAVGAVQGGNELD